MFGVDRALDSFYQPYLTHFLLRNEGGLSRLIALRTFITGFQTLKCIVIEINKTYATPDFYDGLRRLLCTMHAALIYCTSPAR